MPQLKGKQQRVPKWHPLEANRVKPFRNVPKTPLQTLETGQRLLNMTVDDLYKLNVEKLGHQEIILESLELLRNFHYNLDQENLQYISLRLSCKARSLYNEMSLNFPKAGDKQVVTAPVMSSVADVLDSVRLLLSWLERKPFDMSIEYHTVRTTLISLSLELATNAQRDTFAEQPMDVIRSELQRRFFKDFWLRKE